MPIFIATRTAEYALGSTVLMSVPASQASPASTIRSNIGAVVEPSIIERTR